MKKILKQFLVFAIMFFGIIAVANAQASYFYNTTLGTTAIRITALESGNLGTDTNPFYQKQYVTITGYADGEIQFSFGDSLFATKTSMSIAANTPIPIFSEWLPKHYNSTLTIPMIWMKSSSGTINVDIQYRVW